MADTSRRLKLISLLRRLGPIYRFVRSARWQARQIFFNVLRHLLPLWPRLGPPKGLFSACELLRENKVPGEILLDGQACPPVPPGSLRIISGLGQDGHQPWPVFWTLHRNARLVGEACLLLDERKRACAEAVFRQQQDGDPGYSSLWLPPATLLAGNWTSVVSRWSLKPNFYHWLMDCLPRLALLDRLPPDTRVLVPVEQRAYHADTLRWLGLEQRARPAAGRHLLVENFYFSPPTAMGGCANPYAVQFLREKFLDHADAGYAGPEKVFIHRRGKTRGMLNEEDVLEFFRRRGWEIIDLEALTLAQQIKLFAGAHALCGLHGAGFTNLLWCRPDCLAVELCPRNFLNGCYEAIAESVGLKHRFLVCDADRDFCIHVDLDRLVERLKD